MVGRQDGVGCGRSQVSGAGRLLLKREIGLCVRENCVKPVSVSVGVAQQQRPWAVMI